jgi:GntR family transcriptional repressor for pyruvate dehydrogenase complex
LSSCVRTKPDPVGKLVGYLNSGRFAAGDRLPSIKKLSIELAVPSHAVRDALLHAQTIGLVKVRPRSGVYVQSVDFAPLVGAFERAMPQAMTDTDANLLDLLEARRVIEAELAAAAAAAAGWPTWSRSRPPWTRCTPTPGTTPPTSDTTRTSTCGSPRSPVTGSGGRPPAPAAPTAGGPGRAAAGVWAAEGSARREVDAREHGAIYAALLAGDPVAARAAVLAH